MGALRERIEPRYAEQVEALTAHPAFRALEDGRATRDEYTRFLARVVRAHIGSTRIVAFLYALAPPAASEDRLQNLLEEVHHPGLLRQLAHGAGLGPRLPELEAQADADLRAVVVGPLLYGSLREVGFAALCEVVAFEYGLARIAGRVARALRIHLGLSPAALRWWTEHAEVDGAHAEQGLEELDAYAAEYGLSLADGLALADATLRGHVLVRRYLAETPLALGGAA
jgi:hypothetical protein